jgi:hypothetical protein
MDRAASEDDGIVKSKNSPLLLDEIPSVFDPSLGGKAKEVPPKS